MRQEAWTQVKIVLNDYPKTDYYIQRIRTDILYPYRTADENIGGGSSGRRPDVMENIAVSIADDHAIRRLEFNRDMVDMNLNTQADWFKELIDLMYFSRNLSLTPASERVGVTYRTAKKYYERFMLQLAKDLGFVTFDDK